MAWENVIIKYRLVKVFVGDEVGKDWVYIGMMEGGNYLSDAFVFKVPIYKKKNIKRK